MCLDSELAAPSCLEVEADPDPAFLASLREDYPTMKRSLGGDTITLSRFPEGHRSVGSAAEKDFGHWIPERQKEALLAVFVLALAGSIGREDVEAVIRASC